MTDHVHDCTGPDMTCHCGFTFRVPRYCVSISVYDGETQQQLVEDGFNTDHITAVTAALQRAVRSVSR